MMLCKLFLFSALVGRCLAADCLSDHGTRCLPKSEVGDFASIMLGGDPCFLHKGKRMCFVGMGSLNGCSCTPECGCTEAPKVPECDNSQVPQNPDCTADKATFCSLDSTDDNGQTVKNTMCIYCGVDVAKCNKVCTRLLSADEQRQIVNAHNDLRRKVAKGLETKGANGSGPQPKAADMFQLSWDPVLATSAQRWADQCSGPHDQNRNVPAFTYVGQNTANSWSGVNTPDKSLAKKVQMWYNEVANWPSGNVGSFSNDGATGVVGHYTQLIWGATTKIGCGYVGWVDADKPQYPYRQTLICNYGIGGNMGGAKVYTVGETASACPNGSNDGLCL